MKAVKFPFLVSMLCLVALAMNAQNYVDLGLPSGTLWSENNESEFYDYDAAVRTFGSNLPTKEQFEELKNSCQWSWKGYGYKVVGPNGASIVLSTAGHRICNGSVYDVGTLGCYWSSTSNDSPEAHSLFFNSNEVSMSTDSRCFGLSVRLVQPPQLVTPDLTFFQLHGPVKKLTQYEYTYEFDVKGNLTKVNGENASNYYYRDSHGRILSEEIDIYKEYYWDSERPIGCNVRMIGDISYTYDDRGFIVKEEGGMGNFTYTYDKLDEFGNWVSRKSGNGETLVRKIEYYNASSSTTTNQETTIKITNKSVGPFTVGSAFPKSGQVPQSDLTIKQESHTEIGEGDDYTVVVDIVMSGKDKVMELNKGASNNNIDEIMVYSSKAKTAEGVGIGTTVEEFFKIYSNASLGFSPYSTHGMIILQCDKYENCQFLIPLSYLKREPNVQGDWIVLKPSDFQAGSKIQCIRVY